MGGLWEVTFALSSGSGRITTTRNLAMDTSQFPEILRQERIDRALSNPALYLQ